MSETPKAVFLSYAREDSDAARRIAEALRGHGVEAWFDQSELRGGDAWDAKIKKQIRECALFLPLISTRTQERHEGYFRREWKLGVSRTHDMSAGMAFLVPVVIDDTPEKGADVPEEFMHVQWTRLPGALPTPQFVAQVKSLLESPRKAVPSGGTSPHVAAGGGAEAAPLRRSGIPGWTWGVLPAVIVAIAAGVMILRKPAPMVPETKTSAVADAAPPAVPKPAEAPAPVAASSAKSIAVLPFANFSQDKDNEFFADGLQDEVITALAKIHDLKVISRTSVQAYKNPEGRNLKKIASELGVATVLEGSVQRAGDKVHLNVQLIDAQTDDHLWADSYTKDMTDVFTVESELAAAVTSALKATLSPEEKSLIARRPTDNQEAYDLYLRARALSESLGGAAGTREDLDRVAALYEEAVTRDPAFTLAYVQLCATHGLQYWFAYLDPTPARKARAKSALDAALRLAPDSPEARFARGIYAYTCENDWASALEEYRAAEAGLPNDAQLIYYIGLAQRRLGRLPEALASFARSVELNPRDATAPTQQVQTLHALRRFAEERGLVMRYLARFPDNPQMLFYQAATGLELDRDHEAYFHSLETNPSMPNDPHGLMKAYRNAMVRGDFAAADRALADPRLTEVTTLGGVINDPVALHRAIVAFLRGQPEAVRPLAEEAIATFRGQQTVRRQEAWVMMHTGLALALAGRADEALQLAREAVALESKRDAFDAIIQQSDLAQVYLVLGRREDALAELRAMMTGPGGFIGGPEGTRLDPFWSRLKDDPRFEEILKSAKPL